MELLQLCALFPSVSEEQLRPVWELIPQATTHPVDQEFWPITWQGVKLFLPYRVYFAEPPLVAEQRLTNQQQQMLQCLYLRHHTGWVRQWRLEQLLRQPGQSEAFSVPFICSLLGDYVKEILELLAAYVTPQLLAATGKLLHENPRYWQQTQARVVSYWDAYYRRGRGGAARFGQYVGAQLLAQLQPMLRPAARTSTFL
ncbi:MAG: hypothetical protein ACRYFX_25370 [Janthinobacterium lividum]